MSLPAASLSAFSASSLRQLFRKLWRRVEEDVETWSTMGVHGRTLLGTDKEAAGTAKELVLPRKER